MLNAFYFCYHKQFYFTFTQNQMTENSGQVVFFLVCCIDSRLSSLGGFTFKLMFMSSCTCSWICLKQLLGHGSVRGYPGLHSITQKRNIKNKIHFRVFTLQPPDVVRCILMHFSSLSSPQKLKQLKVLMTFEAQQKTF